MRNGVPTVVVTGASAGVGRACAIAFAKRGYQVGLIARSADGLRGALEEVEAAGGRGIILVADVADADAVERAAGRLERELGPMDVWVNSAMVTAFSPFIDMSPLEYRRITEVTYLGQVYGTFAALKRMRARNRGTIVQVGSALAYRAIPLQSAYCGAKHATRGFTDALRSELIHDGSAVRLTMVQLPAVNTPQFEWALNRMQRRPQPVPPIFTPESVADAIVRAALQAPRELWVGPSAVKVILGSVFVPGWLDGVLATQGYRGQQSEQQAEANAPHNLFTPVDRHATRGRFTKQAKARVWSVNSRSVRMAGYLALVAMVLLVFLLGFLIGRS